MTCFTSPRFPNTINTVTLIDPCMLSELNHRYIVQTEMEQAMWRREWVGRMKGFYERWWKIDGKRGPITTNELLLIGLLILHEILFLVWWVMDLLLLGINRCWEKELLLFFNPFLIFLELWWSNTKRIPYRLSLQITIEAGWEDLQLSRSKNQYVFIISLQ